MEVDVYLCFSEVWQRLACRKACKFISPAFLGNKKIARVNNKNRNLDKGKIQIIESTEDCNAALTQRKLQDNIATLRDCMKTMQANAVVLGLVPPGAPHWSWGGPQPTAPLAAPAFSAGAFIHITPAAASSFPSVHWCSQKWQWGRLSTSEHWHPLAGQPSS